jgi:hypothetical protein
MVSVLRWFLKVPSPRRVSLRPGKGVGNYPRILRAAIPFQGKSNLLFISVFLFVLLPPHAETKLKRAGHGVVVPAPSLAYCPAYLPPPPATVAQFAPFAHSPLPTSLFLCSRTVIHLFRIPQLLSELQLFSKLCSIIKPLLILHLKF